MRASEASGRHRSAHIQCCKDAGADLPRYPRDIVDDIILTDDASRDETIELGRSLGLHTIRHDRNRGYGGNQKTCYAAALEHGADIVVMLHPDYQYTPKLIAAMLVSEQHDAVLASRILGRGAIVGGCRATSTWRNAR
ncbi:MAG: glycosyltransferase [Janthinobacterium lividum]